MKKHEGKCALCGKYGSLSFEHIPPECAFNSSGAKPVSTLDLLKKEGAYPWETKGIRYKNLQQGMGLFSLCEDCNSLTGAMYGNAYCDFAKKADYLLKSSIPKDMHTTEFSDVYPLRIIKQIISMFCSINPTADIDDLRSFVMEKDSVRIDIQKYRVYMCFTNNKVISYNGFMGIINFMKSNTVLVSQIVAYPFSFFLYLNPEDKQQFEGFDITSFANCSYDDIANIKMPIDIRSTISCVPCDFRTMEQIIEDMDKGKRSGDT